MVSHHIQKNTNLPPIKIDDANVKHVDSFNFLGITIDEHIIWRKKTFSYKVSGKISRTVWVLNKLKHFLPLHTKITMYNSLILPHINYGLLTWGFKGE